MELMKEFRFEASHILPKHPGKCHRLHGHSWILRVYVEGKVNPKTGFVLDYADLSSIVKPLIEELDHRHLGSWYPDMFNQAFIEEDHFVHGLPFDFYPSSENLLVWIAQQLTVEFMSKVTSEFATSWSKLELDETCTSRCSLTRDEYERSIKDRNDYKAKEENDKSLRNGRKDLETKESRFEESVQKP